MFWNFVFEWFVCLCVVMVLEGYTGSRWGGGYHGVVIAPGDCLS